MEAFKAALEVDLRNVRVLAGDVEARLEGERVLPLRVDDFVVVGEPLSVVL